MLANKLANISTTEKKSEYYVLLHSVPGPHTCDFVCTRFDLTYSFTTKNGSSSVMSALNDTRALIPCCNIHSVHLTVESSGKCYL